MTIEKTEVGIVPCDNTKTKDWHAWNNLQPPKPDFFHIIGEVYVPNLGVEPHLHYAEPQGINPEILLLDLHLIQLPGAWPRVFVWKQVRYDRVITKGYTEVEIRCDGNVLARVPVDDIH